MLRPLRLTGLPLAIIGALVLAVAAWLVVQPAAQAADAAAPAEIEAPDPMEPTFLTEGEPAAPVTDALTLPEGGTPILTVRDGETVDLRSSPGGDVVTQLSSRTEFDSPTVLSVAERRGNWAGVPTQLLPNGELGWVRLDDKALSIDSVGVEIVVDLSDMEAELLRDGKVEHSWVIGIGAPESPTPTGRFSITDAIEGGLNPVYGCCALALSATQPNLPPGWTGGNRMAIHGGTTGVAASIGCVRSADEDLQLLLDRVPLGTPVTIQD